MDDEGGVGHLLRARQDPGHVRDDEEGDDDDGDVGHVELLAVAGGAALVEDLDAAADPHVQHDEDGHRRQARRRQRVDLRAGKFKWG